MEGIIDPDVKCLVVQPKRAPTAYMIPSVAASVSAVARASAPSVPPIFSANNDVLTRDRGSAYEKCPDFRGLLDLIKSALGGGGEDDDWWPEDLTVHGNKIPKGEPSTLAQRHVRAAGVTPAQDHHLACRSHKAATVPSSVLRYPRVEGHLQEGVRPLPHVSGPEPANYKAPGHSQFCPIPEHPLESVCIHGISMPALTVKELRTKRMHFHSLRRSSDVCGPTLGLHGGRSHHPGVTDWPAGRQTALPPLVHSVETPLRELLSDKGNAFMSSWLNNFCHLLKKVCRTSPCHSASSTAYTRFLHPLCRDSHRP